jgi:hypothetical protein
MSGIHIQQLLIYRKDLQTRDEYKGKIRNGLSGCAAAIKHNG